MHTIAGALDQAIVLICSPSGKRALRPRLPFIGCVSDVDQREAREVGEKAVQFAMWGQASGSVTIKRTGFYSVDYELVPLDVVAGKTRVMEDEFISASGTDVTDAFRLYLRPLLGSGMADAFRLRPNAVAKVLNRGA
jgi:6-phosphofructokinase 1